MDYTHKWKKPSVACWLKGKREMEIEKVKKKKCKEIKGEMKDSGEEEGEWKTKMCI